MPQEYEVNIENSKDEMQGKLPWEEHLTAESKCRKIEGAQV